LPILEKFSPGINSRVQAEAIVALETGDAKAPAIILASWKSLRAEARTRAVGALVATRMVPSCSPRSKQSNRGGWGRNERPRPVTRKQRFGTGKEAKILFTAAPRTAPKVMAEFKEAATLTGDAARQSRLQLARCHMPRARRPRKAVLPASITRRKRV
jgi:hypothetical protein